MSELSKQEIKKLAIDAGLHVYDYPMSAACGAVILYTKDGGEIGLLTTKRSKKMGGGRSLSAGGFCEVKDMFNTAVGTIQLVLEEIYREMIEELGDEVDMFITKENFLKRAEFVTNFMVHKGNSVVNTATIFAFKVDKKTAESLRNLITPTEEQAGVVIEYFDPHKGAGIGPWVSDKKIDDALSDFLNPEEVFAAKTFIQNKCDRMPSYQCY